jgi:hypothetical protein
MNPVRTNAGKHEESIMNLRIAATVMAVALWTLARLPDISTSEHVAQPSSAVGHSMESSAFASSSLKSQSSGPSTGWEVKYLRPLVCPPDCPQPGLHVDFDKARNSLVLHKAEKGISSGQALVMTNDQEDDSLYITFWKASERSDSPPNCEYSIEVIHP